jgi:PTH1 family peptidyl-tRNA hydrolase
MIELVAFFGNPGDQYARTRHNAGWLLGETLPFFNSLPWQQKFKGRYASLDTGRLPSFQRSGALPVPSPAGQSPAGDGGIDPPPVPEAPVKLHPVKLHPVKLHFIIPETFMNLSGDSVYPAAAFFKIPPERILVIHDELELPLGFGSLKFSGGLGGHNGLRSMKARFGTADFWRLRIGIGRPDHGDIAGWVLSAFSAGERTLLDPVLEAAGDALIQVLLRGPEALLPEWNKKRILPA